MRPTTIAMALALGIGLPCIVVQWGGFHGWPEVWALAGIGFALGIVLMVTLDETFYRVDQASQIRQRDAMTNATMISTLERESRLQPVTVTPIVEDRTHIEQAWRVAFHRFITAGNLYGFKVRDLGAGEHKVVEWEDWSVFREPLIDIGVLEAHGGTRWAEGWNYARWQREQAVISLPFLEGMPPPVALVVNSAQKQQKQQTVIDGEVVRG